MKIIYTLIAAFWGCINLTALAQTPEQLVKKSFENYKQAILMDNAKSALDGVDSRTKKYYQDLLEKTKSLDSIGVEKLPSVDKFSLLLIRHKLSKERVLEMAGNDLFLYAIESGMVGKNSVADNCIGKVVIDGAFAKGQLVSKGKAVPFYLHFYKEGSKWRTNITSLFPIANMSIKKMAEDKDKSQTAFLIELLELMTGVKT